jgi:serine protease Do
MMNPSQLACVVVASSSFSMAAIAENLECRWFIPIAGQTVPVRCDDANSKVPPSLQVPVERALLGLTLASLTPGLKDSFGIGDTINGVVVTQVDLNTEAAGRGIARGDVILKTNEAVVSSPEDVARSVENATKDGQKTILLLLSNVEGKTESVALPLG